MWFACICRVWLSGEITVLLRKFWHSLLNNVGFEVMLDGFFQLLCVHFIPPSHLWRDSFVWMAHRHYCRLSCFNVYRIWHLSKRINLSDGDHDEVSSWKKCMYCFDFYLTLKFHLSATWRFRFKSSSVTRRPSRVLDNPGDLLPSGAAT